MLYAFEEMLVQSILNRVSATEEIHMVMEYSGEGDGLVIKVEYGGEALNPQDGMDEVSRKFLELATNTIVHNYSGGKNTVELRIR
jgi:hypothetical protein